MLCFLLYGWSKLICCSFCCEYDDENIDYDEVTYEHLSSRRRQELDNLRSISILRKLGRFTLTLKRENMTKRLPDSSNFVEENSGVISSNVRENCNREKGEKKDVYDVETGDGNDTDTSTNDLASEVEATSDDAEYTHVLLPHPSYDIEGKQVRESSEEDEKKSTPTIHSNFLRKSKESEEDTEGKEEVESEENRCATDDEDELKEHEKLTEKRDVTTYGYLERHRDVPIFCAVCLLEYEISEKVCWASNDACSHVFHEDCILQWLVSLGRKRSKRQSFPRNPTDKKLLDFDLNCPCCRQDFISKTMVLKETKMYEEKIDTYD